MSWFADCCGARSDISTGFCVDARRPQQGGRSPQIVHDGHAVSVDVKLSKIDSTDNGNPALAQMAALVGPVCCVATLACVAGAAASSSTCMEAVVFCSAPALLVLMTQWGKNSRPKVQPEAAAPTQPTERRRPPRSTAVVHQAFEFVRQISGQAPPAAEDNVIPVLKPSHDEVVAARRRGEDPHLGQRLNYLAGTSIPFEPLLLELQPWQQARFREFEESFPQQLAACKELDRAKFFQEPDRFTLLIFLQADGYDVGKATARLINTMVWRQQSGFEDFVDKPNNDAWRLYKSLRPRSIVGYDKIGRPLSVEPLGELFGCDNGCKGMSMKNWLLCYAMDISLQQVAFRQTSIRHGRPIHRVGYIGDLAGMRLWQAKNLMGFLRELSKGVETHFPECVGSVVLVNAPSYFSSLYNVAKRFLDPKTTAMVSIHSDTPYDFLREKFGVEALPQEFGGQLRWKMPHIKPLEEVSKELGIKTPFQ